MCTNSNSYRRTTAATTASTHADASRRYCTPKRTAETDRLRAVNARVLMMSWHSCQNCPSQVRVPDTRRTFLGNATDLMVPSAERFRYNGSARIWHQFGAH